MNPESCAPKPSPERTALHNAAAWWLLAGVLAFALAVRIAIGVHFDGLDDVGYLEAADRVASGRGTSGLGSLFHLRVGMAYPLGWLLQADWLRPDQFRLLTLAAELVTIVCLFAAGRRTLGARVGVIAAALYAIYPLAIAQASRFDPVPFQVASVSLALFFLTHAGGTRRRAIGAGMLGGVALGLGYLVKEDVALVVPALAIAAFTLRVAPRAAAVSMCAGAALVFGIESIGYWISHGSFWYRLHGTSGAGTSTVALRIGAIWDGLSYPRSLFVMPHQVGLFWWFAIPAVVAAFRSSQPWLKTFAWAFLIVGAYLQFGTNSISSYLPLPRTPRYTAIVTPFLMLLIAAWLSHLAISRRTLALGLATALVLTSIPCVAWATISGSERRRNTIAAIPVLRELAMHGERPVIYTDFYSARSLRMLLGDGYDVRTLFHADFDTNQTKMRGDVDTLDNVYVLLDDQSAKIYTSTYQMTLPAALTKRPADWQAVWTHDAYPTGTVSRSLLDALRALNARAPRNFVTRRVETNLSDMLDAGTATLYYAGAGN